MLLLWLCSVLVFPSVWAGSGSGGCNKSYCHECIQEAGCAWCYAEKVTGPRCQNESYVGNTKWCPKGFVENPKSECKSNHNKTIQRDFFEIQPQEIDRFLARRNQELKFDLTIQPNKYQLDVYFLIDAFFYLKQNTKNVIEDLIETYNHLKTSDKKDTFRIGYGSFGDKSAMNFYRSEPIDFLFKNQLKLTNDYSEFNKAIKKHNNKEGSVVQDTKASLDGLMQAMLCHEEIGWRENSSKIIVVVTDGFYRSSGDGREAGAVLPHDMRCHLQAGNYVENPNLDYPSVSQINRVAQDNNIKIVFAVTNELIQRDYEVLTKGIEGSLVFLNTHDRHPGSTSTHPLSDFLDKQYENMGHNLQLVPKSLNNQKYKITFDPACRVQNKVPQCFLQNNGQLTVSVKIELTECPSDTNFHDDLFIEIIGLPSLKIKVTGLCGCENCKKNSKLDICQNDGAYECGVCRCKENTYGPTCNCTDSDVQDMNNCNAAQGDMVACNGKGDCTCGKCRNCKPGWSGDHCEFRPQACFSNNGIYCSGNGKCEQNKCICNSGWTKSDCSCSDNRNSCLSSYFKDRRENKECSGHGTCECGKCICTESNEKNETYSGNYCEYCSTCAQKRCEELKDYANCRYQNSSETCNDLFKDFKGEKVDVIRGNKSDMISEDWHNVGWCKAKIKDTTSLLFKYKIDENTESLRFILQNELEVQHEVTLISIIITVSSVLGGMLLLGLFTYLIWMLFDHIRCAREYEKFLSEAKALGYDTTNKNPLYQDPVVNYRM